MLKALLRSKLHSLSVMFRGKDGKKSVGKIILMLFLFLYSGGMFTVMFGELFGSFFPVTRELGATWLVFTLFSMLAFSLMFITSVFTTKSYIFEAKDNDLLLSMPVPPLYIVISRLFIVCLWNIIEEMLITIPLIVAMVRQDVVLSAVGYISLVFIVLTLPMLATALASIVGALVSFLTKRLPAKSLMTVIISLVCLGAYMYFFPKIMQAVDVENIDNLKSMFDKFPPVYWLGSAIGSGNIIHLLLTLAVCVLPFAAVLYVLHLMFYGIVTDKGLTFRKVYKEKELRTSSAFSALLRREFIRLGKTPIYLLNESFGALMAVAGGVALIIFAPYIRAIMAEIMPNMPAHIMASAVTLLGSAAGSVIWLTAPSVSLEGKTLYIIRSMPVKTSQIILSKLALHTAIACPAVLFLSVTASAVLGLTALDAVSACITALIVSVVTAEAGLLVDLRFPMLDWDNAAQPVKQGTSLLLTMLISGTIIVVPVLIVILFIERPDFLIVNLCYMASMALVCAGLYFLLMKNGEKMMERISK